MSEKPPWDGYGDDREGKLMIHEGDWDDLTNPPVESRKPGGAGVSSGGGSGTRRQPAAVSSAATTVHPLRIAYARTLQAILAVNIVRFDVDESLGGDPRHLDEIEATLAEAQRLITRLAVAERINLGDDDAE